jgi:zinc/manganese transport system substrate-binding protein
MRTIIVLSLAILVVAGCGSASGGSTLDVVASTNVYGDITAQIGGAHVRVTSVLSDPNADPHLFEPGTQNGLAVAQAKVVIQNGVGYDDFMGRLESASPSSSRIVVTIADVLGVHGRDANPHLWYDVPRLPRIAGAIAAGLEKADAKHAGAYRAGLDRFVKSLRPLDEEVRRIRTRYAGRPVAYTEPVPGYLVAALGLRNLAPAAFTRAIQNGSEPPAEAVAAMNALIAGHRVDVLLYNSQAVSPITARVRAAAKQAGIPVVGVTETLPRHLTFQQWQLAQVRSLQRALAG